MLTIDRKRRVFVFRVLVGIFAIHGVSIGALRAASNEDQKTEDQKTTAKAVRIVVDFGDGFQKHYRLPWQTGSKIQDYMIAAQRHQRGIKMNFRGRGETAFMLEIDGLKNQGARGNNWIYRVNGKLGTRSFGAQSLQPGDRVLWKFEKYR